MTELQKKELELLSIFLDICKNNNFKYYLVCGSALGAVKYKGFIPWDDDIDVAMPREDYERFLETAQEYLPEWVFLQNYRTDKAYPGLGSKLRNSNTTFIEHEAMKLPINHGVFIDVFPLDGHPKDEKEKKRFDKKRWHYYRRRYTGLIPFYHRDIGLTIYSFLRRCFGMFSNTHKACRANEELLKQYSLEDSELWCNYANSMRDTDHSPREYFGEGTMMIFEGLEVRIPEMYDKYLTRKYGDYRKDPPREKQVPWHGYIMDMGKPYTEYLSPEVK